MNDADENIFKVAHPLITTNETKIVKLLHLRQVILPARPALCVLQISVHATPTIPWTFWAMFKRVQEVLTHLASFHVTWCLEHSCLGLGPFQA